VLLLLGSSNPPFSLWTQGSLFFFLVLERYSRRLNLFIDSSKKENTTVTAVPFCVPSALHHHRYVPRGCPHRPLTHSILSAPIRSANTMLKTLSHEDVVDRSVDHDQNVPPMLNPALLGPEETMLGSTGADGQYCMLSTSQFTRRSYVNLTSGTTSPTPTTGLVAPTPRSVSAGAQFGDGLIGQRSAKLTPLQAEVRRIRDQQILVNVAAMRSTPIAAAEPTCAGDYDLPPLDTAPEDAAASMNVAAPSYYYESVSPMRLGTAPALSPMHLGEVPVHVLHGKVGTGCSRPLTPSSHQEPFVLPVPHYHVLPQATDVASSSSHAVADLDPLKDMTPTSSATPTPVWAAPAIRAQAASSFRREGHGRAKEQVVQHHRVVLNSPMASTPVSAGCGSAPPPMSLPLSPSREGVLPPPFAMRRGASETITMWPPNSTGGGFFHAVPSVLNATHSHGGSAAAMNSPGSETAPPSTGSRSSNAAPPPPPSTAVPGVTWLSDSSSEGGDLE